jgi:DNA-directed RNA polymerase specialized sigma24 family protein
MQFSRLDPHCRSHHMADAAASSFPPPPLVPLQPRFSRSPDDDGVPDDIIQMHDEFSQEAERLEQRELLDVAFNRVRSRTSDSMWRAFELLTLADFSAEDVAEMLGVSRRNRLPLEHPRPPKARRRNLHPHQPLTADH